MVFFAQLNAVFKPVSMLNVLINLDHLIDGIRFYIRSAKCIYC